MNNNDYEKLWNEVEQSDFYKEKQKQREKEYSKSKVKTKIKASEKELPKIIAFFYKIYIVSIKIPFENRINRFKSLCYTEVKIDLLKKFSLSLIIYSLIGFILKFILSKTLFKLPNFYSMINNNVKDVIYMDDSKFSPYHVITIVYDYSNGDTSLMLFYLFVLLLLLMDIIRLLKLRQPIYSTFLGDNGFGVQFLKQINEPIFEKRYYASDLDRLFAVNGYKYNYITKKESNPLALFIYYIIIIPLFGSMFLPAILIINIIRFFLFGHFIYAIAFLFIYKKGERVD